MRHISGPRPLDDDRPGVTFAVDLVEPATEPLPQVDAAQLLTQRMGTTVVCADAGAEQLLSDSDPLGLPRSDAHPLADAVHFAYSQHRPLMLSPDVVWITITQGIAQHVTLHAEQLRDQLVDFEGKRQLVVERAKPLSELDWRSILERVCQLPRVGLGFWTERLIPMCEYFVTTAEGAPDVRHWQDMYKLREAYGTSEINGWFSYLFPYTLGKSDEPTEGNPMLTGERDYIESSELPKGLSRVPVVGREHGTTIIYQLVGGITGVAQDRKTLALTPVAGWAVSESSTIQRALAQIRQDPQHVVTQRRNDEKWRGSAPASVLEFFQDHARVLLFASDAANRIELEPGGLAVNHHGISLSIAVALGKGPDARWIFVRPARKPHPPGFVIGLASASPQPHESVHVIAESFEEFLEHCLAEGAYFCRPEFVPVREETL